ncbi:MAG TPA: DNA gyrase inhibitor YacG [Blastocatellia bacterium]|nr:DNA gyrase inhibitor YacG [Blastocatellia bacterium]
MRRCPVCRREVAWEGNEWRPFCSERCQQIDLGRWASEEYRVPVICPDAEEFSSESASTEHSYDSEDQ